MTDERIIQAWDILAKLDFFGGQRAGRELWNEKPVDIQNEDIENFKKDIAFLKEFINRQKAEIEFLKQDAMTPAVIKIGDEVARREKIKAEAIKEFADRLKKLYETYPDDEEASALYLINKINEIVKEMKR